MVHLTVRYDGRTGGLDVRAISTIQSAVVEPAANVSTES